MRGQIFIIFVGVGVLVIFNLKMGKNREVHYQVGFADGINRINCPIGFAIMATFPRCHLFNQFLPFNCLQRGRLRMNCSANLQPFAKASYPLSLKVDFFQTDLCLCLGAATNRVT